jgi:hypothetical protein
VGKYENKLEDRTNRKTAEEHSPWARANAAPYQTIPSREIDNIFWRALFVLPGMWSCRVDSFRTAN